MDLVAGQKVKLQWLPCKVDHSGPANVGEYFKVKEGAQPVKGTSPSLEATFRGRQLRGTTIGLERGFTGFVLESNHENSHPTATQHKWTSSKQFSDITYWNHDDEASEVDPPARCLEWLEISKVLAAPIDPDEIAKRMQ